MAKATTASALDFNKLETAISVVAPIAKSFGLNARDTAALLGTLANAGFDAGTAATALRNILLEYSKTGGKVQETLGRQVGSFSELVQSFRDLRQQGMGVGEAFDLVGKRSAAALVVLTSMVDETQSLRDNLEDVDGALSDIQSRRLDTLQGETKLLKSAWEDLNLSLSNSKGFLRDIVHWTTAAINGLNQVIFRDARLRASQSRRQAEITQIYDTQGAQAAVAAANRANAAAYKAWNEFRNLSPMARESKGGSARLLELREELEAAREVYKSVLARQRADAEEAAKAAKAAELAALQEAEAAAAAAAEKAEEERLKAAEKAAKEREKVFQDEVAALEKELAAEDAVLYAGLVKENKTWEKGIEQRERDAERMRRAMLGVQMGRVGERADLDVARASLEITDEKERAARIYEIRKKANEDRLALLKDYGDKAAKAGRLEEALEAQRQYHEVEVQMEADAIAEKIRLRKKDAEDEKKRYAATTKALQGVAAITGNVASAYEGYIQTRLEAGQITQEEAEAEFKHVKELQYAQTWINTLAGMVSVWAGEGTNAMKALLSASVLTQGIAATAQIAATNLGSTASAAQAVTGAAVAAPVIINQLPQVQAMTSASQEERLNERAAAQRVYVVYSDIAQAGRRVQVTENEGRF